MTVFDIICSENHRDKISLIKSKIISELKLNYHSCVPCKDNPDFENFVEVIIPQ